MPTLRFNAQIGDDFHYHCEQVFNLAQSLTYHSPENHIYPSELYNQISWSTPEEEFPEFFGMDGMNKVRGSKIFLKFLEEIKKNINERTFEIHFDFNGYHIVCKGNCSTGEITTVKDMSDQQNKIKQEEKERRAKWLKSSEGKEHTRQKKEEERKKKEREKKLEASLKGKMFQFSEQGEVNWNLSIESNKDPYGMGILEFARKWAILMEQEMGETLMNEVKTSTSFKADTNGITGYMYSAAVIVLSQCWKYGEQLRVLHNKDY